LVNFLFAANDAARLSPINFLFLLSQIMPEIIFAVKALFFNE